MPDAVMNFSYYGTDIALFGAKRANHGNYQVQLDGGSASALNGTSAQSEFQQIIFSASPTIGNHNIVLRNGGNSFLDVDYVSFYLHCEFRPVKPLPK